MELYETYMANTSSKDDITVANMIMQQLYQYALQVRIIYYHSHSQDDDLNVKE